MPSFHQLVHTLSYGDAISGEVLTLQRCFRRAGHESEIFCINVHPAYEGKAHKFTELPETPGSDIILHYSLGSPLNELYRRIPNVTRTLIYHNLTPAKWFRGINHRIVRDIEHGLKELPELCKCSDRLLADSPFNAQELANLGFKADVLELPIDPERWSESANVGISDLVKSEPGIHLLHVGRLAPNKCIEDIIKIFYFLHHYIERKSKLWLVGIDIDTELYSFALKRLSRELEIDDAVQFVGALADSEVKALYQNCSAYICMSEHEGFCLPLVEAMHYGLPVVAYDSSAVPATLGGAGILVKQKRHAEIAEVLAEVCRDSELRTRLIESGKKREKELSLEKFSAQIADIFFRSGQSSSPSSMRGPERAVNTGSP